MTNNRFCRLTQNRQIFVRHTTDETSQFLSVDKINSRTWFLFRWENQGRFYQLRVIILQVICTKGNYGLQKIHFCKHWLVIFTNCLKTSTHTVRVNKLIPLYTWKPRLEHGKLHAFAHPSVSVTRSDRFCRMTQNWQSHSANQLQLLNANKKTLYFDCLTCPVGAGKHPRMAAVTNLWRWHVSAQTRRMTEPLHATLNSTLNVD